MPEHRPPTPIQAGETIDPRRSPEAGAKRREAMNRIERDNKRWDRNHGPTDAATFTWDILPRIQALRWKALMSTTGLTKGACSRLRAGNTIPHSRTWAASER